MVKGFNVIVGLSGDFDNYKLLERKLRKLLGKVKHPHVVIGETTGPYKLVADYCFKNMQGRSVYHREVDQGKKKGDGKEGVRRNNELMCLESDALVVFHTGAMEPLLLDLVKRAKKHRLHFREVIDE